jgi:tRNA pseudouridine55 synthase
VNRLEIARYEYPELVLDIECGGGTYVRSLGRDLARAVGTGSVMSALVRTAIGRFQLATAVSPDRLAMNNVRDYLLPPTLAVENLPQRTLTKTELDEISHGRPISSPHNQAAEIAALDDAGRLRAILVPRGDDLYGPNRYFDDASL